MKHLRYSYTEYVRTIAIHTHNTYAVQLYACRKMINLTYGGGEVTYSVNTVSGNGELVYSDIPPQTPLSAMGSGDECCYLFISRKRSQSIQPPSLTVDSNPLKQVQSYKYLGVLITVDLTWSAHLQVISTKTRKLLGIIYRRFYSNSTSSTMFKLYKSFIRPII